VEKISFHIGRAETVGIVGESGSGKSMTAMSIMRLVPQPAGRIIGGDILFSGRNLLRLPEFEMRKIRGKNISMIFQEPMTSLNPVINIGNQISETMRWHQKLPKKAALKKTIDLLSYVGIASPETYIKAYPHELSGGMKQRVLIAMALSCNPQLLIADEPTTALDVTVQAQILALIVKLQKKFSTAVMLITHDFGIIAETAQRVIVMYTGQIIEQADISVIFQHPSHPYTKGLLDSVPKFIVDASPKQKLPTIPGMIPDMLHLPTGCKFSPRCTHQNALCEQVEPPLIKISENHWTRCWLWR